MTDQPILVRRAGAGDVSAVLALLHEHYGDAYDVAARHEWMYRKNPHGPALTWIAYDRASGEPAGLTSVFPRRVSIVGVERLGSIGGDGFVRPKFRRRGIATELHRASLREMRDAGVELMYGPPEPNNLAALVKAGSKVVCQLRRFVRPLDPRRLGAYASPFGAIRRLLQPGRSRLRVRPMVVEDRRLDALWEESLGDFPIAPVRDAAFYAWRYGACPSGRQRHYLVTDRDRAVAACALERDGERTVILDLLAPRRSWHRALDAILSFCRDDAAIEVRLNERGPLASALLWHGFVPRDRKAFQVLVDDAHPQASELRKPGGWFYTTGDGDVERVLG
jgi:GNAT superfamily N-acetyltransferase